MATGYTRQSSGLIITGATILASHHNNEYNAIENAFNATTGHDHDGTAGGGAPIILTSSVSGILPIANGGTNASTASAARTSLGLVIGTDVQAYDAGLLSIAGLTTAANTMIYTTALDTYATTALTAAARTVLDDATVGDMRTTLGLAIGTNVQAWDTQLDAIAALTDVDGTFIVGSAGGWVAESGATARASLGLVIGTDVQAQDPHLDDLAALSTVTIADQLMISSGAGAWTYIDKASVGAGLGPHLEDLDALSAVGAADNVMVSTGVGTWAFESGATLRTSLGLAIGTDVQAQDPVLEDLSALTAVSGADQFIVSTAAGVYAHETASQARTSMGLGSLATLSSVNNSNWSGADLAVGNGGTGVSSLTQYAAVLGNGTGGLGVASPGAAGRVLTSNGTGAFPTFQDPPFSSSFTSTDQTITAAGALTLAHSFGAQPKLIQLQLVNQTAEHGYTSGQIIVTDFGGHDLPSTSGTRGAMVRFDTTNIYIRFGSEAATWEVVHATTGVYAAITNANWKLRVKAWA